MMRRGSDLRKIFDKSLDSLAEAIEHILAGAWLAEEIGLPLK